MTKASDNVFPKVKMSTAVASTAPTGGEWRLETRADGLYAVSSNTGTGGVGPFGSAPGAAAYTRTSANYTTSSTTFADIDGTNLAFTFTTKARRVLIGMMGSVTVNNVAGEVSFDVTVDGVRQGHDFGIVYMQMAVVGEYMNASFSYLTDLLSAGSHTFKLQWRVGNGAHTATLLGSSGSGMYMRGFAVEQG